MKYSYKTVKKAPTKNRYFKMNLKIKKLFIYFYYLIQNNFKKYL